MLIPAQRLIILAMALCLTGVAVSLASTLAPLWLALSVLLLVIAGVDAALGLRQPVPDAARSVPASLPLGVVHEVALRIAARNSSSGMVEWAKRR